MESATKESGVLHFRVDGAGVSEQLRELWTHYKPDITAQVLLEGGMNIKQLRKFIAGKLTLNFECQVIKCNEPALPTPEETMVNLGEYYKQQFAEYAQQFVKAANPKRNKLTGCATSRKDGAYNTIVAKLSLKAQEIEELRLGACRTFERLQELGRLLDIPNRIEAIPDRTPDFLRLYAEDIQADKVALSELEESLGIAKSKRTYRQYPTEPEVEEEPEVAPEPTSMAYTRPMHGYLAPDGLFYGCDYQGHRYLAPLLRDKFYPGELSDEEKLLDAKGWVKMSGSQLIQWNCYRQRMTPAQLTVVMEWFDLQNWETIPYNGKEWKLRTFLNFQAGGDD